MALKVVIYNFFKVNLFHFILVSWSSSYLAVFVKHQVLMYLTLIAATTMNL